MNDRTLNGLIAAYATSHMATNWARFWSQRSHSRSHLHVWSQMIPLEMIKRDLIHKIEVANELPERRIVLTASHP
jgi:hypothetical protein